MVAYKKIKVLITPSPWWFSAQKLYIWVSAQQRSQWCSPTLCSSFLSNQTLFKLLSGSHTLVAAAPHWWVKLTLQDHAPGLILTMLEQAMMAKGSRRLLQRSQLCHQGELGHLGVSAWWRSWQSKNLHGPFLRTVLPTKVEVTAWAMAVNRNTKVLIRNATPGVFQHQIIVSVWKQQRSQSESVLQAIPSRQTLFTVPRQFGKSCYMTLIIRTQMSGLTLVSEGSGSLAELQRVQRLLHLISGSLRGCRVIKEKSFCWHLTSEICAVSDAVCQFVSYGVDNNWLCYWQTFHFWG